MKPHSACSPFRNCPSLAENYFKASKGKREKPQLLMEIGSLHNMLVINNELSAHWHTSATAEGALYRQEDANDEQKNRLEV